MKNVMKVEDIDNETLLKLFLDAEGMRGLVAARQIFGSAKGYHRPKNAKGRLLATVFLEPSTRTRLSFEAAMKRLGGEVISAADSACLSIAKGESICDTLKDISCYADVLVVRSSIPHDQWMDHGFGFGFGRYIRVPVINAGDGPHHHPTQAITDAYTIWRQYGYDRSYPFVPHALNHCIVGDLGNSRAIRSYVELHVRQSNHNFYLYDSTGAGEEVPGVKPWRNLQYAEHDEIIKLLPTFDVIYLNRVQKERWKDAPQNGNFTLNEDHFRKLKPSCMVLNPGPRQEELPVAVTNLPQCRMWEQAENGMYVRMALLNHLLDRDS